MPTSYRVRQFAELAGGTVKALRHYDGLGLLKPMRSGAGYRLYRASDLARLQQIVALKSAGLPLKHIRTMLDRDPLPLIATFRQQREVLEDRRRMLDRAIQANPSGGDQGDGDAGRRHDAEVLLRRGVGSLETPLPGLAA